MLADAQPIAMLEFVFQKRGQKKGRKNERGKEEKKEKTKYFTGHYAVQILDQTGNNLCGLHSIIKLHSVEHWTLFTLMVAG